MCRILRRRSSITITGCDEGSTPLAIPYAVASGVPILQNRALRDNAAVRIQAVLLRHAYEVSVDIFLCGALNLKSHTDISHVIALSDYPMSL